jgi:hypothetical protein
MGQYDVAQICLNGHVITDSARRSPQFTQKFCDKCGDSTIMECQNCKTPIRGDYHVDGILDLTGSAPVAPSFCHECGKAYPWTERKLEAAWELADELDELSNEEKEKLKQNLNELIRDTPKTEVAATRVKKILTKIGKESFSAMKSILLELATEAVKKTLFGS